MRCRREQAHNIPSPAIAGLPDIGCSAESINIEKAHVAAHAALSKGRSARFS